MTYEVRTPKDRCPARDGGDWPLHPITDDCRIFMAEPEPRKRTK